MRVEVAFAVPLSAAIWTTYSPGAEKRAVVTGAFGSAKVTVPGPDTWLQATAGAGPGGGGGGGAACGGGPPGRRCLRGFWPTPVHAFRYVLPWRITTRSGPATALKTAGGSACADSAPSPPNASSTSGEATTTAVAFPAVFSSSRLVREAFSVFLMNHLVLRVRKGGRPSGRHAPFSPRRTPALRQFASGRTFTPYTWTECSTRAPVASTARAVSVCRTVPASEAFQANV